MPRGTGGSNPSLSAIFIVIYADCPTALFRGIAKSVRQWILIPSCVGLSPATPAKSTGMPVAICGEVPKRLKGRPC